ncbi:phosphomevalonate kinase [Coemansia spiralis]|uniref:Phosphomevalonate kinase n=2 Tax=Coemansia TaxID=4863 RepID=A0A9W8GAJ6_9FUNG|nr:ribosomal protein S5 domain 2-type protein [Coemansia spiralis]KAJ1995411.1 phosphomevalonate kinase [Coemansia umbellata]KAJ2624761.1 phosphomevalonate kinase [Coemansia sp. RSA 1358]KAJ2678303.1 phosphomevalonate kinase [Coemansia spiralis]
MTSCSARSSSHSITLTSAPGKVLVVGGYLVLDRNYSGLVVGTDASLYAAVQEQTFELSDFTDGASKSIPILVVSPQFQSAWWNYAFDTESSKLAQRRSADQDTNGFVQVVLEVTLGLVNYQSPEALQRLLARSEGQTSAAGLKIVLSADNDFYSQRETLARAGLNLSSESLKRLPRMCETGTTLKGVHKTGLGSSAAMVTSLVACILVHFNIISVSHLQPGKRLDSEHVRSLQLIHNIAQYAHCLAQGKVGSGFDISAAVYGTHVYRRFSPAVLKEAMDEGRNIADIAHAVLPSNPGWNSDVEVVTIPPRFILRLADVDVGSNTPSMVKKVLYWQEAHQDAARALWNSLDTANNQIRELWGKLVSNYENDCLEYNQAIDWCSVHKCSDWKNGCSNASNSTVALLCKLVDGIKQVRALQRKLGDNAGVPIEPPEQTKLLDACLEVPGVCMAAVPGAGGYDAIFCVTLGQDSSAAVESLWSSWKAMSVGPLLANQASSGVCVIDSTVYPEIMAYF